MKKQSVSKLAYSALFLAIAMILPLLTGQIKTIGAMLSPMHIPVLLCGFLCGWPWGMAVGFLAPILRSLLFGMPKLYPSAVAMMFELAAYGAVAGLMYRRLPKKVWSVYVSLIVAMVAGRLVWGAAQYVLLGLGGTAFTAEAFLAGAVLNAVPGIILHIVLIPPLVLLLRRTTTE